MKLNYASLVVIGIVVTMSASLSSAQSQQAVEVKPRPPGSAGNADNVPFIGGRDASGNPVRLAKKSGHVSNYDESKVAPYSLPDPLKMDDGQPVRTAEQWRTRRDPATLSQ